MAKCMSPAPNAQPVAGRLGEPLVPTAFDTQRTDPEAGAIGPLPPREGEG